MSNLDAIRSKLLKEHDRDDYAIWHIHGEDPNCDFGGYHSQPFLETVEGRYENVVEYALTLPSFFTWGGGGAIKRQKSNDGVKVIGKKISAERILDLRKKRRELEKQMAEIDKELNGM